MKNLEDWAAVQRVYKQTKSKRATANVLGISRNTVRKFRKYQLWLDVQKRYTAKRGKYLDRFRWNKRRRSTVDHPYHPTLLICTIPPGDDPLGEMMKRADDYMFSFRWIDGTNFNAVPCIDKSGSLLICDTRNMDMADIDKTNSALIEARKQTR